MAGINHKTAPVELRERIVVDSDNIRTALKELVTQPCIAEACIVSTCNRIELYAVMESRGNDDVLTDFIAGMGGLDANELSDVVICLRGHHVVKHLFEVASGLDSMALGETQILGQIRNAYCIAEESQCTGTVLNNLFQRAISVGKRARTETGISCGAFSIGAAAAQLAKVVFGDLRGRRALVLGAGEMGKLAARHLKANGVGHIFITNRTRERVDVLAEELGGEVIDFNSFGDVLSSVDVLISSTSAPQPIITKELMTKVMQVRGHLPIFLIDIAVPRDIASEVSEIEGVFSYNIDDLQFFIDRCRLDRESEIANVRAIIEDEVAAFMGYLRSLEAVPLIKLLREKCDSVYTVEWERCSTKLAHLSESDREIVRRSLKSAVKKLTHDPILRIKDYAQDGSTQKLNIVCELFDLHPGSEDKDNCIK